MKNKLILLDSFQIEKDKRTNSKDNYHKNLLSLWNQLLKKNKKKNFSELKNAFMLAKNLRYSHEVKINNKYFFHCLRVASMILFFSKNNNKTKNNLLILALIHNCLETTKITDQFIESMFGKKITSELNALTINRKYQWNKIYKSNYYKKLSDSSKNARVVKIFDKLDNLFVLDENPNHKTKIKYLAEIKRYILPMVKTDVDSLYDYFKKLIDEVNLTIHGNKKYL